MRLSARSAVLVLSLLLQGLVRSSWAQSSVVGTYTVTIATGDVKAVPAPMAARLAGAWVVRFTADGRYEVLQNGQSHVTGTFVQSGDRVTLNDESGDFACKGDGMQGTYKVTAVRGTVTFVKLKDEACPGRVTALTTRPFHISK